MDKDYIVTGRVYGHRAIKVKAKTSSDAMKIARKAEADDWCLDVYVSSTLSAKQAERQSNTIKNRLANKILEKILNNQKDA